MASREPRLKGSFRIKGNWILIRSMSLHGGGSPYEAFCVSVFLCRCTSYYGRIRADREFAGDSTARADFGGSNANTSPRSGTSRLRPRSCIHSRLDTSRLAVESADQEVFQRSAGYRRGP